MKIKAKKFWRITYCHHKYNEEKFEMVVYSKNVQGAIKTFYKELHSNWYRKASDYLIVEINQLEVSVNEQQE